MNKYQRYSSGVDPVHNTNSKRDSYERGYDFERFGLCIPDVSLSTKLFNLGAEEDENESISRFSIQ